MKSLSFGLRFKLIFANVLVVLICLFAPMRAFRETATDLILVGFDVRCRLITKMLVRMVQDRLQDDQRTSVHDLRQADELLRFFLVAHDEMRYVALLDAKGAVLRMEASPGFDPTEPSPPTPDDPKTTEIGGEHIKQYDWEIIARRPFDQNREEEPPPTTGKDQTQYERAGFARVGISMSGVDERVGQLLARFWTVVLIALVAETIIIFVLVWPYLRRIKDLITGTNRLAQGDFTVQVHDDNEDELSQLSQAFNGMTSDLKSLRDELEEHNRTLEQRVIDRTAALNEALEKLKILDKMKDDFLSSISHEFRTPLTSIRSFSEILLEVPEEDEDTKREFLNIIKTESDRLTRLVNDVLDLVKMEAGELRFELRPVNIVDLIEHTVHSLYPMVQSRSVMMHIEVVGQVPRVRADADRITQVIHNVLSNALKFSPDGRRIEIRVQAVADMVRVSVRDFGIGVPESDLGRIFEKFNQVGDTMKDKPPGTGLGLSICRNLVHRHGGHIWAEHPEDGPGLRVAFEVPMCEPIPEPVPAPPASDPAAADSAAATAR